MTDDTLNAILRRVIMEPAEDTHRLVYADRLDELGEHNRAADIRAAVDLERKGLMWPEAWGPSANGGPEGLPPNVLGILSRGFYCHVECDAATFLANADALVWHETQAVFVPLSYNERSEYVCKCCGNVPDESGCIDHGRGCYTQSEDGGGTSWVVLPEKRAPRPCPPTAQPIRKVVLTTEPAFLDHGTHFTILDDPTQEHIPAGVMDAVVPDSLGEVCFRYRFPGGIEFEFPSFAGGTEAQSDDGDQDDPDAMLDDILGSPSYD